MVWWSPGICIFWKFSSWFLWAVRFTDVEFFSRSTIQRKYLQTMYCLTNDWWSECPLHFSNLGQFIVKPWYLLGVRMKDGGLVGELPCNNWNILPSWWNGGLECTMKHQERCGMSAISYVLGFVLYLVLMHYITSCQIVLLVLRNVAHKDLSCLCLHANTI